MFLSMVRTKLAAVLIGTLGVGMIASYGALIGVVVTLMGMSVHTGAVRHIALAHSRGHFLEQAQTVLALKRLSWVLGVLGMLVTIFLGDRLSQLIFHNDEHALGVATLGIVVFLYILNNAYSSILQGSHHVADLARSSVLGAALGTLAAVFCFVMLGLDGVVCALLTVALAQTTASGFYARRVEIQAIHESWGESAKTAWVLLKLGGPVMLSSLAATATTFIIMALISRELGLRSVGLYSAAYSLSGVFIGVVLSSMGANYYPRLSSASQEPSRMIDMVNEQTEVGLLLTVPGLLACWVLSPWLVEWLYAKEFASASALLQWFLLGCLGKVISWPMGILLLALGRTKSYLMAELFMQIINLLLVWWSVQKGQLILAAMAFCIACFVNLIFLKLVLYNLSGLKWSVAVWRIVLVAVMQFASVAVLLMVLGERMGVLSALLVVCLSALLSVKEIVRMLGFDHPLVQKLLRLPLVKRWMKA